MIYSPDAPCGRPGIFPSCVIVVGESVAAHSTNLPWSPPGQSRLSGTHGRSTNFPPGHASRWVLSLYPESNMDTIRIRGPHGSFEVCANTGHITSAYSTIPREYRQYSSVDMAGYRKWAARHSVPVAREISILCIGLRRYDGQHEAPLEVCREELVYHQHNQRALAA